MAKVRHATAEDMPRLLELGRVMHAESPVLGVFEFDAAKVEQALLHAMNTAIVLVHVTDGVIDGGFVGVVGERWFSRRRMFADLALFVEETKRGGIVAYRLIEEAKSWCQAQGFKPEDVNLGISTGVHPETTGRLYEAAGFELIGGLYRLKEF